MFIPQYSGPPRAQRPHILVDLGLKQPQTTRFWDPKTSFEGTLDVEG